MTTYVNRLMKCGYSKERAYSVCQDFARNLPFVELENFVRSKEEDVDRVEPKSHGKACGGLCSKGGCKGSGCGLGKCLCTDCG